MRQMLWALFGLAMLANCVAADVGPLLNQIKAVGKEGAGNPQAASAWRELTKNGPEVLPEVLGALNDANPRAANWLRSAVETIADRSLASGKPLPAGKLEAFIRDTHNAGISRRLAYEWLTRIDPSTPDRLLPGMLDDPGAELRRDAVEVILKKAQTKAATTDEGETRKLYQKALEHARDRDQVTQIADKLKKLGVEVDLISRFGFLTRWMVVGPFENAGGIGFNTVFPPEKSVELSASYPDKDKKLVGWKEHVASEKLGLVDFNKILGDLHGTTAFAYTVVDSPREQTVDIRAGSNNALKIFLNGKEVFGRDEYHHGMRMDQHSTRATLKAGKNEILVKVCQNEQTDAWAQQWSFQLRLCDALGAAVPVRVALKKTPASTGGEQE